MAERVDWLGDSDFVKVSRGLIDKKHAAELAKDIDLDKATARFGDFDAYDVDSIFSAAAATNPTTIHNPDESTLRLLLL